MISFEEVSRRTEWVTRAFPKGALTDPPAFPVGQKAFGTLPQ
jgi:hypothetical protein